MADKVKIARWAFKSKSTGATYETLLYSDGSSSCNCRGWTYLRRHASKRECKHTDQIDRISGEIVRGQSMAEDYDGVTLIDVRQSFMQDPAKQAEADAIRARAEAIASEATEVVATWKHAADYDRFKQFTTSLYADGTTACTCPARGQCYMANRVRRVYGPKILKGETIAEACYGKTVRRERDRHPNATIEAFASRIASTTNNIEENVESLNERLAAATTAEEVRAILSPTIERLNQMAGDPIPEPAPKRPFIPAILPEKHSTKRPKPVETDTEAKPGKRRYNL